MRGQLCGLCQVVTPSALGSSSPRLLDRSPNQLLSSPTPPSSKNTRDLDLTSETCPLQTAVWQESPHPWVCPRRSPPQSGFLCAPCSRASLPWQPWALSSLHLVSFSLLSHVLSCIYWYLWLPSSRGSSVAWTHGAGPHPAFRAWLAQAGHHSEMTKEESRQDTLHPSFGSVGSSSAQVIFPTALWWW